MLAALALVLGRALAEVRRARRARAKVSLLEALRRDLGTIAVLAAVLVVLFRTGLLDGPIRLPLHTYGLLIATGFLVGIWLAQREARRRGQSPERIADLSFWILVPRWWGAASTSSW